MTSFYSFDEMMRFSEGISGEANLLKHIASTVPNSTGFQRAVKADDLRGTDFWILRARDLRPLSVDFKHRDFCPIDRFGADDVCIEVISQYVGNKNDSPPVRTKIKKTGWTMDRSKQTDYVAYTWPNDKGRRFWLVSFPLLCSVTWQHYQAWLVKYGLRYTPNRTYWTICTYPKRKEVLFWLEQLTDNVVPISSAMVERLVAGIPEPTTATTGYTWTDPEPVNHSGGTQKDLPGF